MSDAPERVFVDTNVLIYLYDSTASRKRHRSMAVIAEAGRLCLSVQVLQEFYVNVTRKLGMDAGDAAAIVADLSRCEVHAPDADDVVAAIDIQMAHQLSFWDAMIVRSAAQLRCEVLYSEALADGRTYEGVLVRNPYA